MDIYTVTATIFSLVYIVLAIRHSRWCFPFAFIGCAVWAMADFSVYNLKFDGFLQLFYMAMAVWGWARWSKSREEEVIRRLPLSFHALALVTGGLLTLILVWLLTQFTTTEMAWLDGGTTVFSVLATFMLIFRFIENWIYLLVCDLVYVYIYMQQDAYAFVAIMVVYSVMAVLGYRTWNKLMEEVDAEVP